MAIRLPASSRNPVSLLGAAIVTAAAMVFFALVLLDLFGYLTNPYIGLLIFVAIPALFLAGLILIPVGMRWSRRRHRSAADAKNWPVIDLRQSHQRTLLISVLALTFVNVLVVSIAAFGSVHYMESSEFCGTACHTTMEPQYVAYQVSNHARVECVQCHVGSGAGAFVEAKLAGARQLAHVLTNRVPRPVPSPEHLIRTARDTCEQCHWPQRFAGDVVRDIREYANDEQNSEGVTTLQLHVGGGQSRGGAGEGIHWHMNIDNDIEYVVTDAKGEQIPYIKVTTRDSQVREYFADGATPEQIAGGRRRRMDCMDCHNRPAHTLHATPERAVDEAMAEGALPRQLPFLRRQVVEAVSQDYSSTATANAEIARRLREFYAFRSGTDRRMLDRAVASSQAVWAQNVFPAMKVTFGTYTSQLGHVDAPGCFRCHDDDSHKARDGRVVSQDCELCHRMSTN